LLSPASRLLVLAPNWLGDLVMATPLLAYLASALGETGPRLVLGVRPAWADLFRQDPRFAGLFSVERKGRHGGPWGSVRLARDLARENCCGVIACPPSLRMGLAARLAGIPLRVGYATDGRGFLLNRALAPVPRGHLHYSHEMLALGRECAAALGGFVPDLPATSGLPAPALPADLGRLDPGEGEGAPIWVLGTAATFGEAKNWPVERVADLVRLIRQRGPARVVLLGDAQAQRAAHDLAALLRETPREILAGGAGLVDLTGRTDLDRVAAILSGARAYIGNDSGLMHLAGALGVPTVGVFGSSNPVWTAPLGPRAGYVTATGFACHPCYRKTCNQPEFCLETVSPETVLEAVDALTGQTAEEMD